MQDDDALSRAKKAPFDQIVDAIQHLSCIDGFQGYPCAADKIIDKRLKTDITFAEAAEMGVMTG
ncbi:hypothetical protein [Thiolapillus sp.]|uniref:hypothetical protein n=1 Tax=Thiolapillus sp. TaxID=2017437 RepID=UPI003AF86D92